MNHSVAEYFASMDYGPAPEDDQPARAWLARHADGFGHFVGGAWRAAQAGDTFDTREPATGARLARVAQGGDADVDAAVRAARAAQPAWAAAGGAARARHLYALARMVQRQSRLFAVLEALDNGKPIRETRDLDVPLVARHFLHHAGWAQLQEAEFADYAPLGVIGQIVPWNFPLLMLAWKIAPALATGNCVVLKPAEYTPLTALLFAELAHEAGLPPGVLNVVTGDGRTGAALVAHADVDKIAFTGSTEVGRSIRAATAGTGKSLTLELGGKSPFIVFDDADLDGAVEGVVDAIWFNQGQVCCAGSRLLVQEGVEARFLDKLRRRMTTLRVGRSLDKGIDLGAIVDPVQLERIRSLMQRGRDEGADVWQPPQVALPDGGCYYPPTLVTGVGPASLLAQEEIFGPVLVSMSFRTPDDAVALANNTRYGLAASVWTETIGRALDVAPRLACGVVWINATNLFDAAVGFGGYRESGYGREGGREGIYEYLQPRGWLRFDGRRDASPAAERDTALPSPSSQPPRAPVDRTAKLFVGGRQVRPDSGYYLPVHAPDGRVVGEVGAGNRKDVRNAVAAARAAAGWSAASAHNRAQVLYYLAENLSIRADEFAHQATLRSGSTDAAARAEVDAAVARLFTYAAWADKFDGAVHAPPLRGVALAMHEPLGVIGIACPDDAPLLALVSLVAPALAMGNRVVVAPGAMPLAATDLYQVVETSDVPAGVLNVVTGERAALVAALAKHDDVDALWCFGTADEAALAERESVGNLKRTFVGHGRRFDWFDRACEGRAWLREAVQTKNIWIPYGD
ncbi:aldehyde dehydrogenase (NAD+) [Paraburkholderia caballeronis]|uniref:aldehyde dehydrogenase family protein n=1 Tax=Paraburkholderia caballeronis TaxID=416943 RepID=UPI001066BDB8|nr:aldehyde dehydrogenase family protein [Paraburkholderia caballeronis]TDV35806.1 aldehyde dehydrogenase (NAD+) [Paraburkholderia caballeronis]